MTYLGWYDGNPAILDSLPPRQLSKRTIEYMGGTEVFLERTQVDFDLGDYRWVVHIKDQVIWVEPNNAKARKLCAAEHTQMGYAAENPTWRNAYLSAANELRQMSFGMVCQSAIKITVFQELCLKGCILFYC